MSNKSTIPRGRPSASRPIHAANPTRTTFDPWHTGSTGHQRAESRISGSLAWRNLRTIKLHSQLSDMKGRGGKPTANELIVVNAIESGGTEASDPSQLRAQGQQTLFEAFDKSRAKRRKTSMAEKLDSESETIKRTDKNGQLCGEGNALAPEHPNGIPSHKQIFRGLTFYVNGSTYPHISDHKLKRQLVLHGAHISLDLRRRTVTHVILGVQPGISRGHDIKRLSGGGLAGGKIQKETTTTKSAGFRYVSVEWVLESLERGKRLPEARFAAAVAVAGRGQQSVLPTMQQQEIACSGHGRRGKVNP